METQINMESLPVKNGHPPTPVEEVVTVTPNGHVLGQPEEREGLLTNGNGHAGTQEPCQDAQEETMPVVMMFLRRRLHILPIFTAIFIILSFIISYIVAVTQGHVEPDFPYISYTAVKAPERCVFGQLINFGAFMLATNIYVRYLQMKQVLIDIVGGPPRDKRINRAALIIGVLSAFGLSMVANFQTVDMRPLHYTGAFLAFVLGLVYCWMQTSLSIRYCRWSYVAIAQLVNSIVLTVCEIAFATSKAIYKYNESIGNGTKHDKLRGVYLVSTVAEWLTAISIVTFALTYYRDFSRIRLHLPRVDIMNHNTVRKDYHISALPNSGAAIPSSQQNGFVNHV